LGPAAQPTRTTFGSVGCTASGGFSPLVGFSPPSAPNASLLSSALLTTHFLFVFFRVRPATPLEFVACLPLSSLSRVRANTDPLSFCAHGGHARRAHPSAGGPSTATSPALRLSTPSARRRPATPVTLSRTHLLCHRTPSCTSPLTARGRQTRPFRFPCVFFLFLFVIVMCSERE
jgi:hypothetical protein